MPFGHLTITQTNVLTKYVRGKTVIDLGCGDGGHSAVMLNAGARHIIGVDKETTPYLRDVTRFTFYKQYYDAVARDLPPSHRFDVGFVSWPSNRPLPGLTAILKRCDRVVYLGKNTDSTACGDYALFQHLRSRKLLQYIPDPRNCMIVVGKEYASGYKRKPVGEEQSFYKSMNADSDTLSYEESEAQNAVGLTVVPHRTTAVSK
jgi:hypothetical protein